MSNSQPPSRFTTQNQTTNQRLSSNTVGLVALSDFRKRRAEVIEQQEREAREAHLSAAGTPDRSQTATPVQDSDAEKHARKKLKKKKAARALVSFGDEEEGEDGMDSGASVPIKGRPKAEGDSREGSVDTPGSNSREGSAEVGSGTDKDKKNKAAKIAVNASVGIVPRVLTKAALRREAAEREALRKEFLAKQAAVMATEIAIPFVFYDGTNTPGGTVRVKKGDFIWVFLDKSRKVGAELGVGGEKNTNVQREWARVGVDDLMLVRGTVIIPHHYEFYFFIINKTIGPGNRRLFDYSEEPPTGAEDDKAGSIAAPVGPKGGIKDTVDIRTLEGAFDDPAFTKVVDRRWYERNKHIYPASVWQEFDPEKDYRQEIRRDPGGNTFFFSK
ncbi:Protein FAM50 [Pleurostoma richardsiae]|uniref:Protein FAM50 n=1 Tax=Pleurostoma richardsiae TaxID=41990 RepID=A0AA38RV75_9PEZI|nr:Protein FAM50 [Pleurostoma richardsiae]